MKINHRQQSNENGKFYQFYDMTTSQGLCVSVMDLGASIFSVLINKKEGAPCPLTLSFSNLKEYETLSCYAGATLAPNAGRIQNAALWVNQRIHRLTKNDGRHQLHGGAHGLSASVWTVQRVSCTLNSAQVVFLAAQPNGLDGYPGNRIYETTYRLEDTNCLTITYRAFTDAPTYINMSNHTYWNLSGDFSVSAPKQELQIFSNCVYLNNQEHLPVTITPVANTAFDFRKSKKISAAVSYNNAYLLEKQIPFYFPRFAKPVGVLKKACLLRDPKSGRALKMFSDAPALVFYSGSFLPKGAPLIGGGVSSPSCAIALEAQDIPDVMNVLPASYTLTTPQSPFARTIRFQFSDTP